MFKGSMVAIVTPFNKDETVNYLKLSELLNWHIEQGTDGIVILGTTGEAATLTREEKIAIFEFTLKTVNGRIPVIAGTGSNNTRETVEFSKQVASLGVDGLLLVAPYYNRANNEGFIRHFTSVANAVDIPMILYNVPSRTGSSIPVECVEELAKHPNIVGIKEASGNLSYTARVAAATPDDFLIFSGNDDLALPVLALGGVGVISVAANVIPKQFHEMIDYYLNGNLKKALEIQLQYLDLINSLFIETNPIPIKEMMNQLGHEVGAYRLPLCEISNHGRAIITDVCRRYFS